MPPNVFAKAPTPDEPAPRRRGLRVWPLLGAVLASLLVVTIGAWAAVDEYYLSDLPPMPDRAALWSAGRPRGLTFLGPDGQVVAHRGPLHGQRVELADLPDHVPLAFLAAEDKRFYEHGPLDPRGIVRAAVANLRAGRSVEGASTISQQLARTLFLQPEKTLKRKVQEAVLARRLEHMLGKDEIFALYLNRIYFGDGAYGLAAASERYFGKAPTDLTLAEAALLAALPKAPTRLAPTNDLPAAWDRARLILATMADTQWITPGEAQSAAARAPGIQPRGAAPEGDLAWVLDAAVRETDSLVGVASPDLVIQLTVDPKLQTQAAKALRAHLGAGRSSARQGALVALAPDGAIRAMVGGLDYGQSPFNRALQARRQPGSAFKPIVWAAALERGVAPYEVRVDRAVSIDGWNPKNYGGGYRGSVTVDRALRLSLNTVAVRLAREAGVDRVAELAHRFGLAEIPQHPGPSLALGAYEVSLLQLTSAYQVLQNGGGRVSPYLVSRVANARGDVLFQRAPSGPVPVYGQYQAGQMVRMMQGVLTDGTGVRAAFGRPAAGKTGTSQNYRDAWFVGFTPDLAAGVWIGNDDNRPMRGVTGGHTPAVIWRGFMTAAHAGLPVHDFDWAPALEPPPVWWDEDPYTIEADYAADEAYDSDWGDDAPRLRDQARVNEGPAFTPGYGRARRPGEAPPEVRIWTPEADGPDEIASAPEAGGSARTRPLPTWPPSVPF